MKIVLSAILGLLLLGKGESRRLGEEGSRKLVGLQQIMGSPPGDRLYPGVVNAKTTPNGNCRLRLNTGGNLMVERKIAGNFKTAWQTGNASGGGGEFFMAMQVDGNVVVYRENGPGGSDNDVVFTSGSTQWGQTMKYKLYLNDETCALIVSSKIGTTSGGIVWQSLNDHTFSQNANPLSSTLKKGNFYSPSFAYSNPDGLTLYLQNDCNLLIFEGNDLADMGAVKWASNTRDPSLDNCHLSAAYGHDQLILYGDGKVLWQSDGGWPHSFVVCLSEDGPYPCDYDGNRL